MKKLTKMKNTEAKKFLLKSNSYCNIELPKYFNFQPLLEKVTKQIGKKELPSLCRVLYKKQKDFPDNYSDVNYRLLNNKDGKYSWRPFELIHPVLYVELVNRICEPVNWNLLMDRFKEFSSNKKIECCSIPTESTTKANDKRATIINWWNEYEQKSISLSLDYDYMAITDISNCYPSIYTHSIAWAIHGIDFAKANRDNKSLLGNIIDKRIRTMSYGQTNGIPQGSTLMDFIAEIVLGYADEIISEKLKENKIINYHILRYRDDYRVFSNNVVELEKILKIISEVLSQLNFKLNPQKTIFTDDVITNSIKKDKIERISLQINNEISLQKQLFIIRKFGIEFPNSGSLYILLLDFHKNKIEKLERRPNSVDQIISIIIDIMYKNPRTYNVCIAILSKIFSFINKSKIESIIKKIRTKFEKVPNTDSLNIWLQRLTIIENRDKEYKTLLCEKVYKSNTIWNSNWLNFEIDENVIIDEEIISSLGKSISSDEVDVFSDY